MTQVMRDLASIARRLATNLPLWAVARGCGMPLAELERLMFEPRFREMVGTWEAIFALSPEQRTERLVRLAHQIIDQALSRNDLRAALFVEHQRLRQRDPVEALAKSFSNMVAHEQAKVRRLAAEAISPAPEPPSTLAPPAPAADPRPAPHPSDRAVWRKAALLCREVFDEAVLHHAVERERLEVLRRAPVEPHELPGWQPLDEPPAEPEPAPEAATDETAATDEAVEDERDLEAEAAARAAFCATMARLPEGVRERVQTLPPQEMRRFILALAEGSFPGLDLDGEAQPQGP
jgi:hypothetical protein